MIFRKFIPLSILISLAIIRIVINSHKVPATTDSAYANWYTKIENKTTAGMEENLPKVTAHLLLGMTIGSDAIKKDQTFYNSLIDIGLVHVVVVSGYNVALVISAINRFFRIKLTSANKIGLAVVLLMYVIVCGAQPPVIRAAFMGYIAFLAGTYGRRIDGLLLLATVAVCMLVIWPAYLVSLSFWLSTMATFGLMVLGEPMHQLVHKILPKIPFLPLADLSTSLACQVMVWPIISMFFGRVSVTSPIYNMCLLWLIPICTVLGIVYLTIWLVFPSFVQLAAMPVRVVYGVFERTVEVAARIDRGSLDFKISLTFFILYYLFILIWYLRFAKTHSPHF